MTVYRSVRVDSTWSRGSMGNVNHTLTNLDGIFFHKELIHQIVWRVLPSLENAFEGQRFWFKKQQIKGTGFSRFRGVGTQHNQICGAAINVTKPSVTIFFRHSAHVSRRRTKNFNKVAGLQELSKVTKRRHILNAMACGIYGKRGPWWKIKHFASYDVCFGKLHRLTRKVHCSLDINEYSPASFLTQIDLIYPGGYSDDSIQQHFSSLRINQFSSIRTTIYSCYNVKITSNKYNLLYSTDRLLYTCA